MVLHREIYWVGRQWAVTGYGLQACDQKQKGQFDIEASRLWEDDLLKSVRAQKWLNSDDFENALSVARKRFPEPPRKAMSPDENVFGPEPVAQKFNMRIEGWSAKFMPQWHIRIRR